MENEGLNSVYHEITEMLIIEVLSTNLDLRLINEVHSIKFYNIQIGKADWRCLCFTITSNTIDTFNLHFNRNNIAAEMKEFGHNYLNIYNKSNLLEMIKSYFSLGGKVYE